jgi:hypothetical protein
MFETKKIYTYILHKLAPKKKTHQYRDSLAWNDHLQRQSAGDENDN